MRLINKTALCVALVLSLYFLASMHLGNISAEQKQVLFQKDLSYDIYCVLQDYAQCVPNMKIVGMAEINGASFLEVQPTNFPQEKSGYILFSSIQTILPAGTPRPQGLTSQ